MDLPAPLLDGIARAQGGAVVLITGAGVSFEPPTSLPLSRECAAEAHRRLVADRVLQPGDCNNPEDLSAVADAVHRATGGQRELVVRLPFQEFRQARPNKGHLLSAALLVESALSAIITLNFDLGFEHALAMLGGPPVAIVAGPQEHGFLATASLIYLHRSANADPETWIVRTVALESDWRNSWEEVIARRILSAPVIVFVGLGSPAGVLIDATIKLQAAIPQGSRAYQVNPGPAEDCRFFAALRLPAENYLEGGWTEFMESLANRLSAEHAASLERACRTICEAEGLDCDDIPLACGAFTSKDLIDTGRLRASWTLSKDQYAPLRMVSLEQIADLLLGLRAIERVIGATADLGENGTIRFESAGRVRGYAFIASGRGVRSCACFGNGDRPELAVSLYAPSNLASSGGGCKRWQTGGYTKS